MKSRYSGLFFSLCAALCAALCATALVLGCSKAPSASQGQAASKWGAASAGGEAPAGSGGAGVGGTGETGGAQGRGRQGGRRSAVVPVQTAAVKVGVLVADRSTTGIVSPAVQSQVAAQVAGVVRRVPHLVGDWVKAGETVIQLDDSQFRLSVSSAQATVENARINLAVGQDSSKQANPKLALQLKSAQSAYDSAKKNYDAQKALFDLGGISASQLDTAASQLSAAQANLEGAKTALDQNGKADDQAIAQLKLALTQAENQLAQAELNLQNSSIRAPFAGQLAAINLQPGMYAGLNTAAFSLVSSDRRIAFSVAPSDAPHLGSGTSLSFLYQGKSYPIKVLQSPSAPISGVVPMVASLGGASFPYGAVGSVVYRIPLASGTLVPLSALDALENQNYVFVVEGGRAVSKNVAVVAEAGTTAAVSGIEAGEVVVLSPPPGLLSGSQVQAIAAAETAGQAEGQAPAGRTGAAGGQSKSWGGKRGAGGSGQTASAQVSKP